MAWRLPSAVIASSLICSSEAPLNLPAGCAATTVPDAVAPAGMTVLPPTSTGVARVAEKDWPGSLSLELSVSPRRTVSVVPAGMTIGSAAGCEVPAILLLGAIAPLGLLESVAVVSVTGGLLVHAIKPNMRHKVRVSAERERIRTSNRGNVSECHVARKHERSMADRNRRLGLFRRLRYGYRYLIA